MNRVLASRAYKDIVATAKANGTCTAVFVDPDSRSLNPCQIVSGHGGNIHDSDDWMWTNDEPNAIGPVKR